MIDRLFVNGCSYMNLYAQGNGHIELASLLGIKESTTIAKPGQCNDRIIRTTIQDMYCTNQKTLYVLGLTFLMRFDLPLNQHCDVIDGHWITLHEDLIPKQKNLWFPNIEQNQLLPYLHLHHRWILTHENMCRSVVKDLIGRLATLVAAARSLGHRMLIFRTVESPVWIGLQDQDLKIFTARPEMIQDLAWCSIPWQIKQGAKSPDSDANIPRDFRHILPGEHRFLNDFLFDYIKCNEILK